MLPTEYCNNIGIEYSRNVTNERKKETGQFFTPLEIAEFMASKINYDGTEVRILDPGFGTGILSCALVEHLVSTTGIRKIEIIGYEIDLNLIKHSEKVLKYLSSWLNERGIELSYTLNASDFIIYNTEQFANMQSVFNNIALQFDIVISNPPYFKIPGEDLRAKIAKEIVNGHPNIYSIFIYYSTLLLKENGQFVFITPRSFASGYYFKKFREKFFRIAQLQRIHLFESRKKTFHTESILQENVIIKGIKRYEYPDSDTVITTFSNSYNDLQNTGELQCATIELLNRNSEQKILHIPVNENEKAIINIFRKWNGSLNKYSLQISTGPVVSFRLKEFLLKNKNNNDAPLYDIFNVNKMRTEHPIVKDGKPQYVKICEGSVSSLIENKNYIFLRRFSTKDDKKRLIASPYFMDLTSINYIGVENHLNYIYRPGGNMLRNEVLGITALLNCSLFDNYFRIINGNINVSSTELRNIPLPPLEQIKEIGDRVLLENNFINSNLDSIVNEILKIEEYIDA